MFFICSWWVFVAKTLLLPLGPPNFSICTFFIEACTCYIIIFDSCSSHCVFLQYTGFPFPVSVENSYPSIVRFAPSLQKQSQYFLTIAINSSFISGITLLFNFICLCSSSLCYSFLNVIKSLRLPSSQVFLSVYCLTVLLKIKYSFVYVICIICGNVSVLNFWSPEFWG